MTGSGPDPALVRDVLVIRPGGLADAVRTVPALRHLRATYPAARITMAASSCGSDLLRDCPFVDRFLPAGTEAARTTWFDVAISFAHPQRIDSTVHVSDVRARVRACWRGAGDEPLRGVLAPVWPARMSSAARMLRLAWLLGGTSRGDEFALWPSRGDRNAAAHLVRSVSGPLVLIHTGSSRAERRWPSERWARVIDLLSSLGLTPVFVGSAADRASTEDVIGRTMSATTTVVGMTEVGTLAALVERSSLFIGTDSGPAALAEALGVPSIIVGPASLLEHRGTVDLLTADACELCGEPCCDHGGGPAAGVAVEPALARVALAADVAMWRWRATREGLEL